MATTSAAVPATGLEGTEDKGQHRLKLAIIAVFAIGIAFVFGANGTIFWEGDIGWHLATGHWVLSHGQVPMYEPFSYTAYGKPWMAHEWLSATLMAVSYDWFGYTGLSLLVTLALSFTFLIIASRLQRWATPIELCVALMVVALVLHPFCVARPMVLMWPMLALWVEMLLRAREAGRAPSWWLVPLMTLWVNLHASFFVGLGLAAIFALESLIESPAKVRTVIEWGAFGLACAVAAAINPHGMTGVLMPFGVFASPTVGLVSEFRPTDFTKMPTFEVALMLLLAVAWWRGVRLAPVRLFLMLAMLHMALAHIRHQALFIIVMALVAMPAMTAAWLRGAEPGPPLLQSIPGSQGRRWFGASVVAACLALLAMVRLAMPVTPPESDVNPVHAFAALPPELASQPVLNEYSLGGPLILRGVRVFMDGRTDAYGDPHFLAYRRIARGDEKSFQQAWDRWHFCWSIFPPENREILVLLDRKPEWRRIYADKFAVVHVRSGCGRGTSNN